ncbi:unnamed protein product [Sphenostylis stenocarpa]|uniref:Uncharacterized protein n=1 Tax=Sphenostylis stenocarpa TaxID=92480 RepID=A0AA86SCB2_9FABA|nr:unnamed protein product [Sphenostylis stenocarpa]
MLFSDPALGKGVLYLATHLSAECFSIEKVVVVRDEDDDDDDDDGACALPLWESKSIDAVGAMDLDKPMQREMCDMKPSWRN